MIIGVDAGCLGIKDKRLSVGVYRLVKDLLEELGKIDKKNSYLLYSFYPVNKSVMESFGKAMKNIIVKPARGWLKLWFPLRLVKDKPDVFIALGQSFPAKIPFFPKMKNIGFIYDLAFEKFPKMYPNSLEKLKKNSKNLVKNSDIIIAISRSTKKDLIKLYNAPKSKIFVLYPGISKKIKLSGKKDSSNLKYFLFVGALKKTKNLSSVINAFAYFTRQVKSDFLLYVAGGDKWLDEEIKKTLLSITPLVRKKIIFLGHVEEDTLYELYKSSYALVSPSFYEGFGLTYLEAMRLGCPVIGSYSGSSPEVIGDAGILVNPRDYKDISKAMIILAKNKRLRSSYVRKGLQRSKNFSAEFFAKQVLQIINRYETKN